MPKQQNYYEILGVSPSATQKEIQTAYRKRMMECHPDKYANASKETQQRQTRLCQQLNEAHSCLSDAVRRDIYDRVNGLGKFSSRASSSSRTAGNSASSTRQSSQSSNRSSAKSHTQSSNTSSSGPRPKQERPFIDVFREIFQQFEKAERIGTLVSFRMKLLSNPPREFTLRDINFFEGLTYMQSNPAAAKRLFQQIEQNRLILYSNYLKSLNKEGYVFQIQRILSPAPAQKKRTANTSHSKSNFFKTCTTDDTWVFDVITIGALLLFLLGYAGFVSITISLAR